jgi:hypothetical protein
MSGRRPLREFDLGNELRPHPRALPHALEGQREPAPRVPRLRQVRERTLLGLERLHAGEDALPGLRHEPVPDLRDELPLRDDAFDAFAPRGGDDVVDRGVERLRDADGIAAGAQRVAQSHAALLQG